MADVDWYVCKHVWVPDNADWDESANFEIVKCKICNCPGERDTRDDSVYWPAT